MIWSIIFIVVLLALDRASKILLASYLANKSLVTLIPGFFGLYLLDGGNTGAAWGILSGMPLLLAAISIVAMIFLIYLLFVRRPHSRILKIAMILIIAGGLGNLYDRIVYGAVTDFFVFLFIDFPIFNVADCCITVGAILAMVYMIVSKKDDPMFVVEFKKRGPIKRDSKDAARKKGKK